MKSLIELKNAALVAFVDADALFDIADAARDAGDFVTFHAVYDAACDAADVHYAASAEYAAARKADRATQQKNELVGVANADDYSSYSR